jgi:hypothetical protein
VCKVYIKSEGQTGAIAPSLDTSCTNRTANKTRFLKTLLSNSTCCAATSGRIFEYAASKEGTIPPRIVALTADVAQSVVEECMSCNMHGGGGGGAAGCCHKLRIQSRYP